MLGKDKAFLTLNGIPFITIVSAELSKVCDDVLVVIGNKEEAGFREALPRDSVLVVKDNYDFKNPVSGILTACELAKNPYIALIGCDMPLIRSEVIAYLYLSALEHSAAVPIWEDGRREPLCSVYNAKQFREAARRMDRIGGCAEMLGYLENLVLVPVSSIRRIDPQLDSLKNINSKADYDSLFPLSR